MSLEKLGISHQEPCPVHGWACVRTDEWHRLYQSIFPASYKGYFNGMAARQFFLKLWLETMEAIPWTLECTYDLSAWAQEMQITPRKVKHTLAQYVHAHIVRFTSNTPYWESGRITWNLQTEEWQPIDKTYAPSLLCSLAEFQTILARRQSLLAQAPGPEPSWENLRAFILKIDQRTCQYCGRQGGKLHCDHIIPRSRGGLTNPGNLITACQECNASKSDRLVEEWLAW